jgi:topoisomerase IA-like protein
MARMTISPTTPADVEEFKHATPPYRIRAVTGRVDGRIVGIGGIAYLPDGTVAAFLEATDEARKYAVTLHKTALRSLKGYRKLVALCDPEIEAAPRWLKRLGFEPVDGLEVYVKHGRP